VMVFSHVIPNHAKMCTKCKNLVDGALREVLEEDLMRKAIEMLRKSREIQNKIPPMDSKPIILLQILCN
jgi:hypothetical protein